MADDNNSKINQVNSLVTVPEKLFTEDGREIRVGEWSITAYATGQVIVELKGRLVKSDKK